MELFTAVPNKMIKATVLFIFSVFPKTAKKIKAPEKAGGKASNNKSGIKKEKNKKEKQKGEKGKENINRHIKQRRNINKTK